MNRSALPALLLSLSLVAAGCGGDDEADAAEPLSKSEFVTQADKICADGNADLETEAEALGDEPSQEEIEAFATDTLVPNLQAQHDDLDALGAPEGDEDEVQAILDALQEGIDALESDPAAVTSSDDPLAEASELAGDYGLEECSV
jgi:hypothetical protein